jgi:hypothetical protein
MVRKLYSSRRAGVESPLGPVMKQVDQAVDALPNPIKALTIRPDETQVTLGRHGRF